MAVSLILALLVAQADDGSDNAYRATRDMRVRRAGARSGPGYAFFEAFPVGGAGITSACSTTAPTGAKGETLTFTRGSVATCTATATGGLVSSGIANGDLVELSSNVARVEYDSSGVKGLRVEAAGQNVLTRFIDYTNAAWSDVGTPTPTTGQASPFSGTYANSAVLYDDNDGAAFEGRSISVAVTAGQPYIAFCLVKAGSLAKSRIALDGTVATLTGLSAATWSIIEVADASASAANITFEIDNGSVASDTGTVIWGGCDVKLGAYRTSIVPTVAAAVTRSAELARAVLPTSIPAGSTYCIAASGWIPGVTANATLMSVEDTWGTANPPLLAANDATSNARCYGAFGGNLNTGAAYATGQHRLRCTSERVAVWDSTSAAGASTTLSGTSANVGIGAPGNSTTQCNCIVSRVQLDPSPTRCR